jgi:hypothetical protein
MHATIPANDLATAPLKPPAYAAPTQGAIDSVVDNLVDDLCRRINGVRETLDKLEQQALQSAASAKIALKDHLQVCVKLNDEIRHMQAVVMEIGDQMEGTHAVRQDAVYRR